MYRTMVRKQHFSGALALCLLLAAPLLPGMENAIELGKSNLWADMMNFQGVSAQPGRWGFKDLALSGAAYAADSATELLLHFDAPESTDATGSYALSGSRPVISDFASAVNGASAAFSGSKGGVSLRATAGGMFSLGAVWADFSIEFWLYPATLAGAENVLSWDGAERISSGADSKLLNQSMRCTIRDRKLLWDFQNLFRLPGDSRLTVSLAGTRQILPRMWHHHLLRFDSREGLLEYRLDGLPEAIQHVTDTGREGGSIAVPALGSAYAGPLVVGGGFSGFLEELRISRRFVQDPVLTHFLGRTGVVTSGIIDLGHSSTRVARIESVATTPSDSGIQFYYQAADTWGGRKLLKSDTEWVPFVPGSDFGESLKTRYIQLRVELFPDGTRMISPRLSSLKIVY
jgi:hypothetical protein